MAEQNAEQRIKEIQQQINARINQLATADPAVQRWQGQIDILQEQTNANKPDLSVVDKEGGEG